MIAIYSDGICEPNPGHACWAWIAYDQDGAEIGRDMGYIGNRKTNQDAEYIAFGKALRWLQQTHRRGDDAVLRADSKLVINQVSGAYQCNIDRLRKYRDLCREIIATLPGLRVERVSGDANPADDLTRQAYCQHIGKQPPVRHKSAK